MMFKRLYFISLVALITGCHPQSNKQESKQASNVSLNLSGLWISQDYIRNIEKDSSISMVNRDADFFISILVTPDSKIEALGADEIEPVLGHLVGDSINFEYGRYFIRPTTIDLLEITNDGKTYTFKRLNLDGFDNTFKGRDYLNSLLLIGTWNFVDPQLNKVLEITFAPNNRLSGLAAINSYYPSSYLATDILLLGDSTEIKRSFILEKSIHGFKLNEVENFDWDESIFKPLGLVYKLER